MAIKHNMFPRASEVRSNPSRSLSTATSQISERFRSAGNLRSGELSRADAFRLMRYGRAMLRPLTQNEIEDKYLAHGVGERFMNMRLTHEVDGVERRVRMNAFGNRYSDAPARLVGYKTFTNGTLLGQVDKKEWVDRQGNLYTSVAILPEDLAQGLLDKVVDDPLYAREFGERTFNGLLRSNGLTSRDIPSPNPQYDRWEDARITDLVIHTGQIGELRQKVVPVIKKT